MIRLNKVFTYDVRILHIIGEMFWRLSFNPLVHLEWLFIGHGIEIKIKQNFYTGLSFI